MSTSLTLFYYYSFDFMSRLLNFTSIYWTCFFLTISATTCVPYLTPYSIFLAKKKPNQLSLKAWDNLSVPISDLIDPIRGIFFYIIDRVSNAKCRRGRLYPPFLQTFEIIVKQKGKNYFEEKSAIQNFKKFNAETGKNIPALNLLDLISFFHRCRGGVRSAPLVE